MKVASYCRVSTDQADQANSFQAQQRYFREYIARQPDWELYEVYADEGITGTSTKKRVQFKRMLDDARLGKFQLILTKEVSRFSRNILDTIAYTRELKQLGVGVLFMNDGIHTLEPDAELRLSIMGSIAQEESRKTSSRVKWGQTRQMERGVVFGHSLLGYDVTHGQITLNPAEADTVKWIFHQYGVEKKGTSVIAKELQAAGVRTTRGSSTWSSGYILRILRNEKYVGDLVQKKTYTPDYLTHIKRQNHGAEPLITIRNHHEPIIDRELWNLVQAELRQRSQHGAKQTGRSRRYALSGKIRCGECGAPFVSRRKYRRDGSWYRRWSCRTTVQEGRRHLSACGHWMGCDVGRLLRDDQAMLLLQQTLQALPMDWESILQNLTTLAAEAIQADVQVEEHRAARLRQELCQLDRKQEDVLDDFFSGGITREELEIMKRRITRQRAECTARLNAIRQKTSTTKDGSQLQEEIRRHIAAIITGQAGEEVFGRHVLERMVVYRDRRVVVQLHQLPQKWVFCPCGTLTVQTDDGEKLV